MNQSQNEPNKNSLELENRINTVSKGHDTIGQLQNAKEDLFIRDSQSR
jgi:hypothetical protein